MTARENIGEAQGVVGIMTFNFKDQDKIGKIGEKLILAHYNSIEDEKGHKFHARKTRMEEQLKGADIWVFNTQLNSKFIEVKTDTQINETNNLALEYLIEQESGELAIGCQMKTFADYMMYWTYPTNFVRYWNPTNLLPFLLTWIKNDTYRTVKVQNENENGDKWLAHCLLVPTSDFDTLGFISSLRVSLNILEKVLDESRV